MKKPWWILPIVLMTSAPARADEKIEICYNYGCGSTASIAYTEAQLERVGQWMLHAQDAASERRILRGVMGKLYTWAGLQSPVKADRGGNDADDSVEGRMDCVDHTISTTRLLKMLQAHGWLRYHEVSDPAERKRVLGVLQHFSATIEARPGRVQDWQLSTGLTRDADNALRGPRFVVDSWFHDNGEPAEIMPLDEWLNGGGPDV